MDRTQEYVIQSLELHLFFARIMKEHAFFLKVGFLPPSASLARRGEHFLRQFEDLLSRTIALSSGAVRDTVLCSGEVVTEFTARAEAQSQRLTGTFLNRELTARAMRLQGCSCKDERCGRGVSVHQVQRLNRDGLVLINGLIAYKENLLKQVCDCRVFTSNYPLLIEHILREARLYRAYLLHLEGQEDPNCRELRDQELFWNRIMMEHALFIRGLLDPTENKLIETADGFFKDYKCLLEAACKASDKTMPCEKPLSLTEKFRDFKCAGVEGIEDCKIRSIILPLLADHVLREANHYIRLLET